MLPSLSLQLFIFLSDKDATKEDQGHGMGREKKEKKNDSYLLELEELRLEFLKRGQDQTAESRARLALAFRTEKAIQINPISSRNTALQGEDRGMWYSIEMKVNLFAPIEQIENELLTDVLKQIKYTQEFSIIDFPENKPPEFKTTKGSHPNNTKIEHIKECLIVYDRTVKGDTPKNIAIELYHRDDPESFEWWGSSLQKTYQRLYKAQKLIEAAEKGTFPIIEETQ